MRIIQSFCILISYALQSRCAYANPYRDSFENNLLFRKLSPKDMGSLHNEIVTKVHDRIATSVTPLNHDQYHRIIYEEVICTCEEDDDICKDNVQKSVELAQMDVRKILMGEDVMDILHQKAFSQEFDEEVIAFLEQIMTTTSMLDDHPLDEVLNIINDISERVEHSEMHDLNKQNVQIAASIATGSACLWSGVQNDRDNAFHHLRSGKSGRHLQTFITNFLENNVGASRLVNISGIVLSDIFGFIGASLIPGALFIIGVASPTVLVENAVRNSIVFSLTAIGLSRPWIIDIILCRFGISITAANCEFYNFLN